MADSNLELFTAVRQAAREFNKAGYSFRHSSHNGWPALKFIDHILYSEEGMGLRYANIKDPSIDVELIPQSSREFRNSKSIFTFLTRFRYPPVDGPLKVKPKKVKPHDSNS